VKSQAVEYYVLGCLLGFNWPLKETIECVPNFSTSDPKVVNEIVAEIEKVPSTYLLDHSFDDYYNRLVVVAVGSRESLLKAILHASVRAVQLIDMNKHKGQHPRLGAVDVVPFVPIENVTVDDCVRLSREYGRMFAEECDVPVYLYGEAASSQDRRDIDWIRKGEYEALGDMIARPERKPDFGPAMAHPTAGATITGARNAMVGFNVNLGTTDLQIGKKIAKALHGAKGGFASVRAMAAEIPQKKEIQIGMSIYGFESTPLHRVFETLKSEARRYHVPITGSEINGVVPLKAIIDAANFYLRLDNLTDAKILETAITKAIKVRG
jgi:glutamate formiminotransferase